MPANYPNMFYTYELDSGNHRLKDLFTTQALADAAALADTDPNLLAYQGSRAIINGLVAGWLWDTTDDKWRAPALADMSTLIQRRAAASSLINALVDMQFDQNAEAPFHAAETASVVVTFMAFARQAAYVVFNSSTWTAAQQIAWAEKMESGPANAASAFTWFRHAAVLDYDTQVPKSACAWVNPDTGGAVNIGAAWTNSDSDTANTYFNGETTDLATVHLSTGAWIDNLS